MKFRCHRPIIKDCPHKEEKIACVEEKSEGKDENDEHVPIVMFTKNEDELILLTKEASSCGVLDSGCASTVCGKQWLEIYMDQLSDEKKSKIVQNNSNKSFQFGGEYKLQSLGRYVLPGNILGTEVAIETEAPKQTKAVIDPSQGLLPVRGANQKNGTPLKKGSNHVMTG